MKKFCWFFGCMLAVGMSSCSSSSTTATADEETTETLTILGSSSSGDADSSIILGLSDNSQVAFQQVLAGSPTSLAVDLYQIYLGESADCTDIELIEDNGETPEGFDMVNSPTLFSGEVAAGTYNCMVMVISDNMTFRPDDVAEAAFPGVCDSETDAVFDIYRTDSDDTAWIDVDGNEITATGTPDEPSVDRVSVFASTDPAAAIAALGISENQAGELTSGLTVPAEITFYADFSDSVSETDGNCWLEGGELGFR